MDGDYQNIVIKEIADVNQNSKILQNNDTFRIFVDDHVASKGLHDDSDKEERVAS